ncbi:chitinase [Luteimicrobium album]|uniref:Chitinase n=1 Tax=Luteimicrobium album TaxID=1054550 RepID=A0ABQ6I1I1_9MICO|nr:glycosyl hydrolase family 18 protein [Luteimicrobium album]GMA24594.1 chitinase [Luteimicrobium album]
MPYCDAYDTAGREKLPNDLARRVIGYYTSWRTGADGTPSYLPGDIPWDDVSHINYAFAHIEGNGKVSVNQDAAGNPATDATFAGTTMNASLPYTGELNLLNTAKVAHPGVRTLVSVGGWAETGGYFDADGDRVASGGFYAMTQSQAKIDAFADSAVAFIRQYGFDGVDIDDEYPTSNNNAGNPLDFSTSNAQRGVLWKNYLALMKTLRQKLDVASAADGTYYELTAAVPASGWLLRGEEVSQMVPYLDFLNMMSYDLHGAWNDKVGGNAPLFDDGQDAELADAGVYTAYKGIGYLNGDWAYHYFRGAMQAGRINLGVPFYTRGWKDVSGGTDGLHGKAALPDQTKCPAGTGPSAGGTTPCGNGADGIDNLWHDTNSAGNQEAAGSNPIWHVLNLAKGVVGDYTASYGSPTTLTGTYEHHFDDVSKTEWWWNPTTKVFLSGDADEAVDAKAKYVADNGLGGIMIWELAGDYAYDSAKGQYEMGHTLVSKIHDAFTQATPYGASKADVTMPTQALDLDVTYSDFALGDNNYPINPKVTFTNNGSTAIPAGSTITFDYASSDTGAMSEQNGWGLTQTGNTKPANNVGGLPFDFYTATIKVPSGGIPAGGSVSTKLSWQLPIAQLSNLRVTVNGTTYATTYDHPRGVTVVDAASGSGSTDGTGAPARARHPRGRPRPSTPGARPSATAGTPGRRSGGRRATDRAPRTRARGPTRARADAAPGGVRGGARHGRRGDRGLSLRVLVRHGRRRPGQHGRRRRREHGLRRLGCAHGHGAARGAAPGHRGRLLGRGGDAGRGHPRLGGRLPDGFRVPRLRRRRREGRGARRRLPAEGRDVPRRRGARGGPGRGREAHVGAREGGGVRRHAHRLHAVLPG